MKRRRNSSRATSTGRRSLPSGVRWVHCGGIFAALSPTTARARRGDDEGRQGCRRGDFVRSQFPREAVEDSRRRTSTRWKQSPRIVENVDVLVGNEEDLQKGLGIPGPEVAAKSKLDPSVFFAMMDKVVAEATHRSRPWRRHCAKCTPPTATVGAPWPGSRAKPIPPHCRA